MLRKASELADTLGDLKTAFLHTCQLEFLKLVNALDRDFEVRGGERHDIPRIEEELLNAAMDQVRILKRELTPEEVDIVVKYVMRTD